MRSAPLFYRFFPRLSFWARRIERTNYEREMELLPALCSADKISVDIGAKLGMYSYRMLPHSAEVVAFEPIPHYNRMLETVFRRRPFRVEPVALSDKPGEAVLRTPFDETGTGSYGRSTIEPANQFPVHRPDHVKELEVAVRTLDEFELENVGFIKIDVEGHELAVLGGAARTIESSRPNLLIEANDEHNEGAVERVCRWLAGRGYEVFFLDSDRLRPIDELDPDRHAGVENFIGVHRDNAEGREALLAARVR